MQTYAFHSLTGDLYSLILDRHATVADVKSLLPQIHSLRYSVKAVFLRNRLLDNHTIMSSLSIRPGPGLLVDLIALPLPKSRDSTQSPSTKFQSLGCSSNVLVTVHSLDSPSAPTYSLPQETSVSRLPHVSPTDSVYCSDVICHDLDTLSFHSVKPGSSLSIGRLSFIQPIRITFDVKCPRDRAAHTFTVPYDTSVQVIRQQMALRLDLASSELALKFLEHELEDRFPLSRYHIVDHSTISCNVRVLIPGAWATEIYRGGQLLMKAAALPNTVTRNVADFLAANRKIPGSRVHLAVRENGEVLSEDQYVDPFVRHGVLSLKFFAPTDSVAIVHFAKASQVRSFAIDVCRNDAIWHLKCRLRELIGIPVARQQLLRNLTGEILPNEMIIAQLPRGDWRFSVKEVAEGGWTVDVMGRQVPIECGRETIGEIKWKIGKVENGAFELLVPGGKVEDKDRKLAELGIGNRANLLVVPNAREKITVKFAFDAKTIDIDLPNRATVMNAKKVFRVLGVFGEGTTRIFNNGRLLNNDAATLESCNVGNNSVLYCAALR
jgi:hypothetical protein